MSSRPILLLIAVALVGCEQQQERSRPAAKPTGKAPTTAPSSQPQEGSKAEPLKGELVELQKTIDGWLNSQNDSEWTKYEELLTPNFVGIKRAADRKSSLNKSEWVKDRRRLSTQAPRVTIGLPHFLRNGDKVAAHFEQTWVSRTFADKGAKVLTLVKSDGRWLIEQEEMLVSEVAAEDERNKAGLESLCGGLDPGGPQDKPSIQTWRFADVGGMFKREWRQVQNWKEARSLATEGLYDVVIVTTKSSGSVLVWAEGASPSGDSFVYTSECYRKDGSLAWWEESYRTFHTTAGLGEAITRASYSPDGKLGAKVRSLRSMETGAPLTSENFYYGNGNKQMTEPTQHLRNQTVFGLLPRELRNSYTPSQTDREGHEK